MEVVDNKMYRAKRMLLYFGIFSIVMLFAGLTSAYVVSMNGEFWVNITLPKAFYTSTLIILASSATIQLAVYAAKNDKQSLLKLGLLFTFILSIAFTISQYTGWNQLFSKGQHVSGYFESIKGEYGKDYTITFKGKELVYDAGKYYFPDDVIKENPVNGELEAKSNRASSFMLMLSGLHVLHLLIGLLYLIGVIIFAMLNKFGSSNYLKVKQCATYWHFLDGLWIYLFLFLLFIH
jgi:cytochrome c oxidase subunit III